MVMVGDPFETDFASDMCRHIHNGPAIPFVTAGLKRIFANGLF
jgi:hypothetical protein